MIKSSKTTIFLENFFHQIIIQKNVMSVRSNLKTADKRKTIIFYFIKIRRQEAPLISKDM